jgi:hypothetical protein
VSCFNDTEMSHFCCQATTYSILFSYPQLQMQAGTTGINTMRVYNVTKQGQDQDPEGLFIRKYLPELENVPLEYIHEPYKMSTSLQKKYKVLIDGNQRTTEGLGGFVKSVYEKEISSTVEYQHYPYPIVDEKSSAKNAKDRLSAVRKQQSTKEEARRVYMKHGSRRTRNEDRNGAAPKTSSSNAKRQRTDDGQMSLLGSWKRCQSEIPAASMAPDESNNDDDSVVDVTELMATPPPKTNASNNIAPSSAYKSSASPKKQEAISSFFAKNTDDDTVEWSCQTCTYLNHKPHALACSMCGSIRN